MKIIVFVASILILSVIAFSQTSFWIQQKGNFLFIFAPHNENVWAIPTGFDLPEKCDENSKTEVLFWKTRKQIKDFSQNELSDGDFYRCSLGKYIPLIAVDNRTELQKFLDSREPLPDQKLNSKNNLARP